MDRNIIGAIAVGLLLIFGISVAGLSNLLVWVSSGGGILLGWISNGGGTLLLVMVTLAYVILTYELVGETRKAREDERDRHRNERLQERINIRSALLAEIEQMRDAVSAFEPSGRDDNVTVARDITYTTVYEGNTDRLGSLTQSEVTATVEAYNEAINMHRDLQKGMELDEEHHIDGQTGMHISRFNKLDKKLEKAQEQLKEGLDSDRQEDYWLQENGPDEDSERS